VSTSIRIKGVYAHLDCLLTGIDRLKRAGLKGFDVAAPLPRHEIEEIVYEGRPSPVRWWTLTGAVSGVTIGFLLPALTHAQWPMINPGGKPVVSLPPFIIIMFESTIMLGALATLVGMIVHAGLPGIFLDKALKDPRFTDDKFGIVFTAANPADTDRIMAILRETGAVEVTSGDDTIYEVPNA
jgi:molybdopterin-containing oxidoreductase family membrane subunit